MKSPVLLMDEHPCLPERKATNHWNQIKARPQTTDSHYLQTADSIYPFCVLPTDASIKQIAQRLCPDFFHGASTVSVEPLCGGLSNQLFVASNAQHSVLVRLHPRTNSDNDDDIIDRQLENRLLHHLSLQPTAPRVPRVYGHFGNGRVEEFYTHVMPLSLSDMPKYASVVGVMMGQLHQQVLPKDMRVSHAEGGQMWNRVDRWLALISPDTRRHNSLLKTLIQEWNWCQMAFVDGTTNNTNMSSALGKELVLCHMDVQSLNLLKLEQQHSSGKNSDKLYLIDYEYASVNARFVDIGNYFCEFCDMNNLQPDYGKQYPSESVQDAFLKSYLREIGRPDYINKLAELRHDIGRYTVLSHIMWAIWAVLQSERNQSLDFDYLRYAQLRLDGFYYFQERFWKKAT